MTVVASAATVLVLGMQAGVVSPGVAVAAPSSQTDTTKVPHYFGPYPNWANSPQVLADAVVKISLGTPTPVPLGNPLVERAYATDYATPPGELGPVFVVLSGSALPAGTLNSFQTWNQANAAGSPTPSAGGLFHAYVLRPTATADEYNVVYDSGLLTVPTVSAGEVATFAASGGVAVQAGDVIGFYGEGIPVDTGVAANPDLFSYPAGVDSTTTPPTNVPPGINDTVAVGSPDFPRYQTQDRHYSFGALVTPTVTDPGTGAEATATVDPKTGGILSVDVTSPGSGYLNPPNVTFESPGITPTTTATATAQISTGVISGVTVNEPGFGFSAPQVTFTGGNPTTTAAAVASGGVDKLKVTAGGSGYTVQPIVKISLPDLPGGVQATGKATMDSNGVVTTVDVVEAGSGYTKAPTVDILDGNQVNPTGATVEATIGIGKIDVTDGGTGYDSAPTVAINDTVGVADKGASATATVAVKGSVTAITVTNAGAGYLTPGLKKFVDTLAGMGPDKANSLGQYIPTAVPDTTTYPGTDYYEIGLVQYRQQFSSQLPATLLRGYVQLSTDVVPGKRAALSNANLTGPDTPITAYTGVDTPHYLGPTIVATKNKPVRVTFRNLLPTGEAGDLFLPVDTSLMGSGMGPDGISPRPGDEGADGHGGRQRRGHRRGAQPCLR